MATKETYAITLFNRFINEMQLKQREFFLDKGRAYTMTISINGFVFEALEKNISFSNQLDIYPLNGIVAGKLFFQGHEVKKDYEFPVEWEFHCNKDDTPPTIHKRFNRMMDDLQ